MNDYIKGLVTAYSKVIDWINEFDSENTDPIVSLIRDKVTMVKNTYLEFDKINCDDIVKTSKYTEYLDNIKPASDNFNS